MMNILSKKKQEVSGEMEKKFFKILTNCLPVLFFIPLNAFSTLVTSTPFKTYLRINISAGKNDIHISHRPGMIQIETLNPKLHEKLKIDFANIPINPAYIKNIDTSPGDYPAKGPKFIINLASEGIEVFNYFKENENQYVLDIWDAREPPSTTATSKPEIKKIVPKGPAPASPAQPVPSAPTVQSGQEVKKAPPPPPLFRDFRYGAALVWDYPPIMPKLSKLIDLERKTPEFFFPIEDRKYEADEKEAHMQLTINLYKQNKWGLMAKSISLYEQKYGQDSNFEWNEYFKANSLLKNNLGKKHQGPIKAAILKFVNIAERTKNYGMKRAILQYLVEYMVKQKDFVEALHYSKLLFVATKEEFDEELAAQAAEYILFNLSNLAQIEKLQSFMAEKTIKRLVPAQIREAYNSYVLLRQNKTLELIQNFEDKKQEFQKPVHAAILFNTAEAYFRNSDYGKAIKLFDDFIVNYSFDTYASHARLRIALSYELSQRNIEEVLALYKDAINKISDPKIRYEAKIRYVGLRRARKIQMNSDDLESLVFLETTPVEKKEMDPDLKKLLWLVRLRSLINEKDFPKALIYLKTLPLKSMRPVERRLFEGDGAEVVYGLIKHHYHKGDYGEVTRFWEAYKDKYIDKVATNPVVNYLVCTSYLNLGLEERFEETLKSLKDLREKYKRSYPLWIEEMELPSHEYLTHELEITKFTKNNQWEEASQANLEFLKKTPAFAKGHFYQGIIGYHLKDFNGSIKAFEKFLLDSGEKLGLNQKETAELFQFYTESLYHTGNLEKFKKYVEIVVNDSKGIKDPSPHIKNMLERISYLAIEVLSGGNKLEDFLNLEAKIADFQKSYPQSAYGNRLSYLSGVAKVNNNKEKEGLKILNNLINDKGVPEYLKELAKSEISSVKFKNMKL